MVFHVFMMFVVAAVSLAMHAMASAAPLKLPQDPVRAETYDRAMRQAGASYNKHLAECRAHAKKEPRTTQRELKACERTARVMFRREVKDARAQLKSRAAS